MGRNRIHKKIITQPLTTEENKTEEITRPRGRPKKIIQTSSINQFSYDFDSKENETITLYIPLQDDTCSETSEKNHFSVEEQQNDKLNNFMLYLSNDENDDDNVKSLRKKLKKHEQTIKKLYETIENQKNEKTETPQTVKPDFSLIKNKIHTNYNIGEKTDIACWWCSYNFDSIPCFVPEKITDNKYHVLGIFCSFNCALSYALKDDEYKVSNRISLLKKMYYDLYGYTHNLFPAPAKEILTKYGGNVTIEDYRKTFDIDNQSSKITYDSIILDL